MNTGEALFLGQTPLAQRRSHKRGWARPPERTSGTTQGASCFGSTNIVPWRQIQQLGCQRHETHQSHALVFREQTEDALSTNQSPQMVHLQPIPHVSSLSCRKPRRFEQLLAHFAMVTRNTNGCIEHSDCGRSVAVERRSVPRE